MSPSLIVSYGIRFAGARSKTLPDRPNPHAPHCPQQITGLRRGSLGALLAWKSDLISKLYQDTPKWLKYLFLGLVITGYFGKWVSLTPLACCGVLIFAQYSRVSRLLDTAVTEYLGRISHSMYLLDATVLWATVILLYGKVPLFVLGSLYCAVILVISHLSCVFIEEPAMRFGKGVTAKKPHPFSPSSSLASGTTGGAP